MGKSSSGTVMGSSGMVDNNGSGEGLVGGKRIRDEEMGLKPPPRRMPMERSVTMGSEMEEWMRDDDDEKLREYPGFHAGGMEADVISDSVVSKTEVSCGLGIPRIRHYRHLGRDGYRLWLISCSGDLPMCRR